MWSDEMKTEIEMELCILCADYNQAVTVPGKKTVVRCGSAENPRCPGFIPYRTGTEGKR